MKMTTKNRTYPIHSRELWNLTEPMLKRVARQAPYTKMVGKISPERQVTLQNAFGSLNLPSYGEIYGAKNTNATNSRFTKYDLP